LWIRRLDGEGEDLAGVVGQRGDSAGLVVRAWVLKGARDDVVRDGFTEGHADLVTLLSAGNGLHQHRQYTTCVVYCGNVEQHTFGEKAMPSVLTSKVLARAEPARTATAVAIESVECMMEIGETSNEIEYTDPMCEVNERLVNG
jgi:putative NADPH-quinone reductase